MSLRRTSHKNEIYLQTSAVAGTMFYQAHEVWYLLQVGDVLTLHREPENPHDEKAIEVFWGDVKLGYVPRTENQILARMMDTGRVLKAYLVEINLYADYEPVVELAMEIWTAVQMPNLPHSDGDSTQNWLDANDN